MNKLHIRKVKGNWWFTNGRIEGRLYQNHEQVLEVVVHTLSPKAVLRVANEWISILATR